MKGNIMSIQTDRIKIENGLLTFADGISVINAEELHHKGSDGLWELNDIINYVTEIIIPDSVASIGNCAFDGCKSLESIVIPDSVMYIEANAFKFCGRLKNIHFRNEHPENIEISESAFWGKHLCTLYVPADAEEAYRHDERFKDFKEIKTER
jgi:hypothetical protein